jgi:hypothetical protein
MLGRKLFQPKRIKLKVGLNKGKRKRRKHQNILHNNYKEFKKQYPKTEEHQWYRLERALKRKRNQ